MLACLSRLTEMLPLPLRERLLMLRTPFIRASMASSFDVTSISTTLAELFGRLKLTVSDGFTRDG